MTREADPSRIPPQAQRDAFFAEEIQRVWDNKQKVYGARKPCLHRDRCCSGERASLSAPCTVGRLMAQMGLRGVVRSKRSPITTAACANDERPLDLVNRDFVASRPNQL